MQKLLFELKKNKKLGKSDSILLEIIIEMFGNFFWFNFYDRR